MLASICLVTAGFLLGALFNVAALAAASAVVIASSLALVFAAPISFSVLSIASAVLTLQAGYLFGFSGSALLHAFSIAALPSSRR